MKGIVEDKAGDTNKVRSAPFVALLLFLLITLTSCINITTRLQADNVASALAAADFIGRVVRISDGDTISVMHNGRAKKIRLNGIDCPEKAGVWATCKAVHIIARVSKRCHGQTHGRDKYRRTIGEVLLPDSRSLNEELVRASFACWYEKYLNDITLRKLQADARSQDVSYGSTRILFRPGSGGIV